MKLVIRPHLNRLGRTQEWLAGELDVNKSTVSSIISGRRKPSFDMLVKIIESLEVDAGQVLVPETPPPDPVMALAEDARPFVPAADMVETLARIAPRARHPITYRIGRTMPGFGLREGDLVVADMNATPATGDLVIATAVDGIGGKTIIRRMVDGYLVADDPLAPLREIGEDTAIMAVILGEVRSNRDV